MRFTNVTELPAGWTLGFRRDGRELLVVIAKATFDLPASDQPAVLAAEQRPLVKADEFSGEPGLSAPLRDTDYAHTKVGCDVLLLGSAHAPGGQPVTRLPVGLKVGLLIKQFLAVGPRWWQKRVVGLSASAPKAFLQQPLSYDLAFGGTDRSREGEGRVDTYLPNPVGCGWWPRTDRIDSQPLPATEEIGHPIEAPDRPYRPQAFGPLGRHWLPRARYAGTYDQAWIETTAPLWPADFDERYFQAAPEDQILPALQGGEEVVLKHLTPDGLRRFRLPPLAMPVTFIPHRGRDLTREAAVDTLVLEPDAGCFSLTWRCVLPLARSVFDVRECIVGEMPDAWHRERRFPGKTYYRSLDEAVRARRPNGNAS